MRIKIFAVVLLFCLIACEKGIENPYSNNHSKLFVPTIDYFTASPSQILWGESFTLSWKVNYASYWSIRDQTGHLWVDSAHIDNPWESHTFPMRPDRLAEWTECPLTTFTLTAINENGQVQKSCTVEVLPDSTD